MMKVRMLIYSGRPGQPIKPGDIISVDDRTGHSWIDSGIAQALTTGEKRREAVKQQRKSYAKEEASADGVNGGD
jgi:hypothetical protein